MAYCPPTPPPPYPAVEKAAVAVLNYGFDLSPPPIPPTTVGINPWWAPPNPVVIQLPWLQPGEEVTGLVVSSNGGLPTGTTDITVESTQIVTNGTGVPGSQIVAWLTGGTVGTVYLISFVWTTNSSPVPRVDERTIQVTVVATR